MSEVVEVVEVVVTEVLEILQVTQKQVEGFLVLELEKQKLEVTQENMHKELINFIVTLEKINLLDCVGFDVFKDVLSLWDRQFYRTTVSVNGTYIQAFMGHLDRFEALFKTVQSLNCSDRYNKDFLLDLLLRADNTQILVELSNTCSFRK